MYDDRENIRRSYTWFIIWWYQ